MNYCCFEHSAGGTNTGETSIELMMVAKWIYKDETIMFSYGLWGETVGETVDFFLKENDNNLFDMLCISIKFHLRAVDFAVPIFIASSIGCRSLLNIHNNFITLTNCFNI